MNLIHLLYRRPLRNTVALLLLSFGLAGLPSCANQGCPARESLQLRESKARRQKNHRPKSGLFGKKARRWGEKQREN